MILDEFEGQTLLMKTVYERHSVDTPYIKRNYKDVLIKLEGKDIIKASKHKRGTFGDSVEVTFPRKRRR
jgi:hypothetical protein